jgi:hypothetical protein
LGNEFVFNNKVFGLLGNISFAISASRTLAYTATISKNGGTPAPIVGYGYLSDVASITATVNLISNIASGFQTFSIGDTVGISIFATNVGAGSDPTITSAVPLIQGVYNALTNVNPVIPASGTLSRTSVTDGPQLIEPANTYQIQNLTGEGVDLFLYPASTLTRTFNSFLTSGETSGAFTSAQYYDVVAGSPPVFPSSPITLTAVTGMTPVTIDPAVQYTFINGSMSETYVVTMYDDGQPPGPALTEIAPTQQVQAPSAGFEGYTVALATPPPPPFPSSPITVTEANMVPNGIDPAVQYTFINGGATLMTITLYDDGQPPGPTLTPTLPGLSVVAPSSGFEGYTAVFA